MKKLLLAVIVLVGMFIQSSPATLVTIADSVAEFSGTQGQDNWYYGYRTDGNNDGFPGGAPHGAFTQMTHFSVTWTRSATLNPPYLNLNAQGSHPDDETSSDSGLNEFAVRRWVSEVSGLIMITGTVRKTYIGDGSLGDSGDGFVLNIFTNGLNAVRVFGSNPVGVDDGFGGANLVGAGGSAGYAYSTNLMVNVGDNIEFFHSSFDNINSDGSIFTAFILQDVVAVPEPSTLLLLTVGGVTVWRWRRNRRA